MYNAIYTTTNGVAKGKNRTLIEMAGCMVKTQELPYNVFLEAIMCATHILTMNLG